MNHVGDMPKDLMCPCGGGQSCIVDRRWIGDWVHEDQVFKNLHIKLRTNCFNKYSKEQKNALNKY
tara:strand:- start:1825 stop:2019 length:195 start_codon:yes stop_codon:yes gene_type:complete